MRRFEYVKRIENPNFNLPERSTAKSGGYDFICPEDTLVLGKGNVTYVKTGVKAFFPENEILLLVNRSSNAKKKGLILINGVRNCGLRLCKQ